MPASMVKNKRDEKLWTQAKDRAAAEGHDGDWPYVVGIFQRMKRGTAKGAHLPGMLLLPEGYGRRVWGLLKGAGHRYIKRVPIPGKVTKTGKPRYRYYYDVAHGGGVASHEHMVEGASFKHGEGHYHIIRRDGPKITISNDATGYLETVGPHELANRLRKEHQVAIAATHDRIRKDWQDAHENYASDKQISRIRDRARTAGVNLADLRRPSRPTGHLRNVPAPSTKLQKVKVRLADGSTVDESMHVAGDWALRRVVGNDKKKTVTWNLVHTPSGLAAKQGLDGGKASIALAIMAHRVPHIDAEHATTEQRAAYNRALSDAASVTDEEAAEWRANVTEAENKARAEASDAKIKQALSKVKPKEPSPFNPQVKTLDRDAAIKEASIAASKDMTRPSLNAVHFDGHGNAVATDGHRLVIVPTSHTERGEVVTSEHGSTGEYPDYTRIIPKDSPHSAEFDADTIASAAKAAAVALDGKKTNIMQFKDGGIRVPGAPYQVGHQDTSTPTQIASGLGQRGTVANIGINYKYLLDALKGAKGTVRISSKDQYSPIVVERSDGIKHLIMPMRI